MKINKEINLADLIKIIIMIVGGVVGFVLIESVATKNDTLKMQKLYLDELPKLYPNFKIHYTNEFDSLGNELEIRVYLESKSKYPIEIEKPPKIFLMHADGVNHNDFEVLNQNQFSGVVSPGAKFNITYLVKADSNKHKVVYLEYVAKIDDEITKMYECLFKESLSSLDTKTLDYMTHKKYSYQERTYAFGSNTSWADFFENPR